MAAKFIVIMGPTASGKSDLALHLAQKTGAVIVNCDSQQVYRELRILSARPSEAEEKLAPHYLYGNINAADGFSAGKWLEMAKDVIKNTGDAPKIFVGGTGMYIDVLMHGMIQIPPIPESVKDEVRNMKNEDLRAQLGALADINHRRNVRALEVFRATGKHLKQWQSEQPESEFKPSDFLTLVTNVSRETLYDRINKRFLLMLESGALDEVRKLKEMQLDPTLPIMKACGVPELVKYLNGEASLEEATAKAQQSSRNYAKRQLTWMRNQLPDRIEVQNMGFADIENLVKERT